LKDALSHYQDFVIIVNYNNFTYLYCQVESRTWKNRKSKIKKIKKITKKKYY